MLIKYYPLLQVLSQKKSFWKDLITFENKNRKKKCYIYYIEVDCPAFIDIIKAIAIPEGSRYNTKFWAIMVNIMKALHLKWNSCQWFLEDDLPKIAFTITSPIKISFVIGKHNQYQSLFHDLITLIYLFISQAQYKLTNISIQI